MNDTRTALVLVEDDLDLLEGWQDLFELSGYAVHGFTSGEAALADPELLRQADVLLSDYNLPDRTGVNLIREARRVSPSLPAVLITGFKRSYVEKEVASEPDIALFFKPAPIDALEQHIREIMTRRRQPVPN